METTCKLVVSTDKTVFFHPEMKVYAARIPSLGLTCYGESLSKAEAKLEKMFSLAVYARLEHGDLNKWLNKSGLEWHWEHNALDT